MVRRCPPVLAALAVSALSVSMAAACAPTDENVLELLDGASSSAQGASATLPPPPDSGGTTPSDTAPPLAEIDVSADALVLAAAIDIGADQLEGTNAANTSRDPIGATVDVSLAAAAAYRELAATEATAPMIEELARGAEALADLMTRYEPLLADPSTAETAVTDFLADNARLIDEAFETERRVGELVVVELTSRGGPVATYLVDSVEAQQQSTEAVAAIVGGLQLLGTDPFGAVDTMAGSLDDFGRLSQALQELSVPEEVRRLHDRQVAFIDDYARTFGDLVSDLRAGRVPATSDLLGLQELATRGPQLNIERSRLMAATLRGEFL